MVFRKFVTGLVAIGLFVCLAAGPSRAEKLLVGYSGISADLSHLWIANEAGLFKKYGVEVVPIYFSGGNRLMQALIGNDIQIGVTSGITSARAIVAGADITIVAGHINKLTYTLYTSKEITKAEQLKGKSMAISGFGTTSHASTVIALKKLGLNPKDVTLFQIGDQASRFAALQANTIQGVLIAPPLTTMAKRRGFNPLMDLTQIALPWSQEVLLANEPFIKKQPVLARNFMKGFVDGLSLWHMNKPLTMELLAKFMKIDRKTNLEALEEAYTFMRAGTERKPYPNAEGLQAQLEFIGETDPRAKAAKADQLVDLRILEELDKSGFIEGLYKPNPPRSGA